MTIKLTQMRTLTACLCLLAASPVFARDIQDCGQSVLLVNEETGKIRTSVIVPGMMDDINSIVFTNDGKISMNYRQCLDKNGAVLKKGYYVFGKDPNPNNVNVVLSVKDLRTESLTSKSVPLRLPLASVPEGNWSVTDDFRCAIVTSTGIQLFDVNQPKPFVIPVLRGSLPKLFITDERLYVFDGFQTLYAFSVKDDAQLWKWNAPNEEEMLSTSMKLYVIGDKFFISSSTFGLFSVNPATGQTLWRVAFHNTFFAPTVAEVGTDLIVFPVLVGADR